jgi:hypothetical protein
MRTPTAVVVGVGAEQGLGQPPADALPRRVIRLSLPVGPQPRLSNFFCGRRKRRTGRDGYDE